MTRCMWPNGGFAPPVDYRRVNTGFRWTSPFGLRTHPVTGQPTTMHYGIDTIGYTVIKSSVDGVVTFAGYNGGAGNEVRIKEHGTGDVFRDLHNSRLLVSYGMNVRQGQDIAIMGTTGSSTGIHNHHEVRPGGGAAVEPLAYYARRNPAVPAGEVSPVTPNTEEEDMPIIIVQKKGQPNAAKGQMTHNRRMRLITKYENTAYRKAQAQNPDAVIYVDLTEAEFNNLLAGKA